MYQQGDIVLVHFPLPKGFKLHPAIIISTDEVYESEEAYLGVMITSSTIRDNFSYVLSNEMLTNPLEKVSQVRCHLIALFHEDEIEQKLSKLKAHYLKELVLQIEEEVIKVK
jgi:mRNA-degrading endonuclease toxin of MazEF toxin-antitoxin module